MGPVGWVSQGGGGYYGGPSPTVGLGDISLFDTTVHSFADALQGVVAVGVVEYPPYLAAPERRVATILILHLRFDFGVAGNGDMSPIREEVLRGKGRTEGLETINQTVMRRLTFCCWVFGGGGALQCLSHPPDTGHECVTVKPLL